MTSIGPFEAEARKKSTEEDILTSRFFGLLNRLNKELVLGRILKRLGIDVPDEELKEAEIRLWPQYDGAIPDAVIEAKSILVFVECKVGSPLTLEQLKREYQTGSVLGKHFSLLCITKDFLEPPEIEEAKAECPQMTWTSWQEMNATLRRIREDKLLDKTHKALVGDLLELLNTKGFRGFAGFKKRQLEQITKGIEAMDDYFNEISIFIRELQSQLDSNGIQLKTRKGSWFHRDGRGTRLESPDD